MVEIETRRLLLRRWQSKDLDAYSRLCADPEVMRYIGSGPLTREQSEEQISRFVRHWDERGFGLWAVEHRASGEFVRLTYQDEWTEGEHKTEVGWGKGQTTEGAVSSVHYEFEEIGLERIIIRPANVASRRVAEKAGLTFRGEASWRGNDVV
jgi:RimJ/RimL family protein N-acetyltransferase